MAWSSVTELTIVQATGTVVSSLAITGVTAAIGDLVEIEVTANNSGTAGISAITTCADSAGNTYTKQFEINRTAGGVANDGVTTAVFTSVLTSALSGQSVTVSFSPNVIRANVGGRVFVPGASETASVVSADATGVSGSGTSSSIVTGSIANGDTVIGVTGLENNAAITADSDTTNGNWSTAYGNATGTGNAGIRLSSQYKTVTSAGAQTYNVSWTGTNDHATSYLVIRSASSGGVTLGADGGSHAVTGTTAALKQSRKVVAGAGSYAVTGSAATLRRNLPLVAGAGSYAVTGTAATLKHAWKVAAGAGSYAVSGSAATLSKSVVTTLAAGAGAYSVGGQIGALYHARDVGSGTPAAYNVTGTDAAFLYESLGLSLEAGAGSYSVSGQSATLRRGFEIAADTAAYVTTGTAASLELGREGLAGAGTYSISGQIAALYHARDVDADAPASYIVTGSDAALTHLAASPSLGAEAGSYSVGGQDASLERGIKVIAASGSYSVSGQIATLRRGKVSAAEAGIYAVSGQLASLEYGRTIVAQSGAYVGTGSDADLDYDAAVIVPIRTGRTSRVPRARYSSRPANGNIGTRHGGQYGTKRLRNA